MSKKNRCLGWVWFLAVILDGSGDNISFFFSSKLSNWTKDLPKAENQNSSGV